MYNKQTEDKVRAFLSACPPSLLVEKLVQIHSELGLQRGNEEKICGISELLRPWFEPTDEEENYIERVILQAKVAQLEAENATLVKEKTELIRDLEFAREAAATFADPKKRLVVKLR